MKCQLCGRGTGQLLCRLCDDPALRKRTGFVAKNHHHGPICGIRRNSL
jgi:hypothetical protein